MQCLAEWPDSIQEQTFTIARGNGGNGGNGELKTYQRDTIFNVGVVECWSGEGSASYFTRKGYARHNMVTGDDNFIRKINIKQKNE